MENVLFSDMADYAFQTQNEIGDGYSDATSSPLSDSVTSELRELLAPLRRYGCIADTSSGDSKPEYQQDMQRPDTGRPQERPRPCVRHPPKGSEPLGQWHPKPSARRSNRKKHSRDPSRKLEQPGCYTERHQD